MREGATLQHTLSPAPLVKSRFTRVIDHIEKTCAGHLDTGIIGTAVLWEILDGLDRTRALQAQYGAEVLPSKTVTDAEIREALQEPVSIVVNAVRVALERTPPELSADIVDRGVVLTVLETQGKWLKLKHSTGLIGWIYKPLLWP